MKNRWSLMIRSHSFSLSIGRVSRLPSRAITALSPHTTAKLPIFSHASMQTGIARHSFLEILRSSGVSEMEGRGLGSSLIAQSTLCGSKMSDFKTQQSLSTWYAHVVVECESTLLPDRCTN